MMLKRIIPSLMAVVLMGLLIGCSETEVAKAKPEKPTTMDTAVFAWEGVDRDGLEIIEKYDINTVLLDYNHSKDIKKLRPFNTLILAGDSSWDADDLKKVVEEAAELKADGVVFDIESDYATLAANLVELRDELENLENELENEDSTLPVYVCIPFWLDTQDGGEALVERIIKATDGVFVMNYYRSDERAQVEYEYNLAKAYGKAIWTIYELQPVGMYDLKDYNTYHDLGLAAVEENYQKMFSDTEVGLAFHTLEMMKELD